MLNKKVAIIKQKEHFSEKSLKLGNPLKRVHCMLKVVDDSLQKKDFFILADVV